MIIPWALIGRLAAAAVAGVILLRLRGANRARIDAAVDLVLTLAIGAAVGGRLTVLVLDALLIGTLPDLRAVVTLGPGLSVPGALIGASIATWRRRRRTVAAAAQDQARTSDLVTWQDAGMAILLGTAVFTAAHLPDLPVANIVRVSALLAAAAWLGRADVQGWHPGLRLLSVVASVHLLAGALTPSLPTVDTDVDLILTTVVLLVSLTTNPRVSGAARRLAGLVGTVVGALVLVGVLVGAAAPADRGAPSLDAADPDVTAILDGAIRAGGSPRDVPAWGADQLAALVRDTDVPVVVNLWAAWCPPCHAEAATVARAARALDGRAVVLGVLVDDQVGDGQAFADTYGLDFPTVVDDGLSDALGMTGLPTTVVLDTDGAVVRQVVGGLSQATLAQAVQEASTG